MKYSKYVMLFFFFMFAGPMSHATTVIPKELTNLVNEAELIFTGTLTKKEFGLDDYIVDGETQQRIFTYYTFIVDESLKGAVEHGQITLRFLGGDHPYKKERVVVTGAPVLHEGRRYLLFVAGNGIFSVPVVGWHQGYYEFRIETTTGQTVLVDSASRPVKGIASADWHLDTVKISAEGDVSTTEGRQFKPAQADQVIGQLRAFIREQSSFPDYREGKPVSSVLPPSFDEEGAGK